MRYSCSRSRIAQQCLPMSLLEGPLHVPVASQILRAQVEIITLRVRTISWAISRLVQKEGQAICLAFLQPRPVRCRQQR